MPVIIIAKMKQKLAQYIMLVFMACSLTAWVGNVLDYSAQSLKIVFATDEEHDTKSEKIEECKVKLMTGFANFSFIAQRTVEVRNLIAFTDRLPVSSYSQSILSPPPDLSF
jgi:hypothetical protein